MNSVIAVEKFSVEGEEWTLVEDIGTLVDGDLIRKHLANGSTVAVHYYAPTLPLMAEILQRKIRDLYLYSKRIIEARESWYASGERYLWPELESECAAYLADPEVKGRNLLAQEAMGLPAAINAPRVVAAAGQLVTFVSAVIANRTAHLAAINALAENDDLEGVLNYNFSGGWPVV